MKRLVDRRALLAASAATFLAAPAVSLAGGIEDPILPVFREWVAARTEWYRYVNSDWDEPEAEAVADREMTAFRALLDATPTTMVGVAALMIVLWDFDGPGYRRGSPEYLDELEQPANKLKAALWRGASRQSGLPPCGDMAGALDFLNHTAGVQHGI